MADPIESAKKKFDAGKRKLSLSLDPSVLEIGKLPPQARELEEAVLGAIMIESKAIDDVATFLKEDMFYVESHQLIYKAIKQLYLTENPIDMLTVIEKLKNNGDLERIGGQYYIAKLTNKIASAANVEYHSRILAQKYIQRSLISSSTEIIKEAYEDTTDVFELLDKAENAVMSISENNSKSMAQDIGTVLKKELLEIDKRINSDEHLNGVRAGFEELDNTTGGWQKSDLIIVAARPGMGKTAFTLSLARNSSIDHKKPVAIFSLEMSASQLVQRMISMETEIAAEKIRRGQLEKYEYQQLTTKIDSLRDAEIYIDDTPGISIFDLRSKCRKLKQKNGIELIIIDYLQLMTASTDGKGSGNREQEISLISRSLKGLAKELNVPVIALSQLSRATETRGGTRKPILSDLRESGAIEQDADIVIFLYRPEYYGLLVDEDNNSTKGSAEIILAKHRNGPLKNIKVRFIDKFAKFADLDEFSKVGNSIEIDSAGEKRTFKKFGSRMNSENDFDAEVKHKKEDISEDNNEDAPW
jgi:replicative DNA helicase